MVSHWQSIEKWSNNFIILLYFIFLNNLKFYADNETLGCTSVVSEEDVSHCTFSFRENVTHLKWGRSACSPLHFHESRQHKINTREKARQSVGRKSELRWMQKAMLSTNGVSVRCCLRIYANSQIPSTPPSLLPPVQRVSSEAALGSISITKALSVSLLLLILRYDSLTPAKPLFFFE